MPHVHFHLIPTHVQQLGKHAAVMGDMDKIKALSEKIKIAVAAEFAWFIAAVSDVVVISCWNFLLGVKNGVMVYGENLSIH